MNCLETPNKKKKEKKQYKKQTHIITTVQRGAKPNKVFLENLLLLKKKYKVDKIKTFVTQGTDKRMLDEELLDDVFLDNNIFELINGNNPLHTSVARSALRLNENLALYYTSIMPQRVNAFLGYPAKLPADVSYIVNSPKARFKMLPSLAESPRFIESTGAATEAFYNAKEHSNHQKAVEQHQLGASIIEIINNKKFIPYQVVALDNGNFSHRGWQYKNGKITKVRAEAMVLGDPHWAVVDKGAWKESMEQIKEFNPKQVHFGDFFDAASITHHDKNNIRKRAEMEKEGLLSFEKEVKEAWSALRRMSKRFPKTNFFLTYDNHSANIEKYIEDKRHFKDVHNYTYSTKVALAMLEYPDMPPLKAAILALSSKEKIPSNIKFLKLGENHKVRGWLLSEHGHKGLNGARGSVLTYDKNNIPAIGQHSHTPAREESVISVGHLSDREKQEYAKGGLTTWGQANAVIYGDGPKGTAELLMLHNNFRDKKLGKKKI